MSMTPINTIVNALSILQESDKPHALCDMLSGDIAAAEQGFPDVVVATDRTMVAVLRNEFPNAVALRPFNDIAEWTVDERLQCERAGVVIAGTTARQLLPRTLVDALNVAVQSGTPVALFVDEVGRTSDPQSSVQSVVRQLAATFHKGRIVPICLGDARYKGPSLSEAVVTALALRSPEAKSHALAQQRSRQAHTLIERSIGQVRMKLQRIIENDGLLRQKENASEILLRAEVSSWVSNLAPLRDAFSTIDLNTIIGQVTTEQDGPEMVRKALELLRANVTEYHKSTVPRVVKIVQFEVDRAIATVQSDIRRLREMLGALEENGQANNEETASANIMVGLKIDAICREGLGALVIPDDLMRLAEWIEKKDELREEAAEDKGDKEEKKDADNKKTEKEKRGESSENASSGTKGGDEKSHDNEDNSNAEKETEDDASDRDSDKNGAKQRIREMFDRLPRHLVRSRLAAAMENIISDALVRTEAAIERAGLEWKAAVPTYVERSYAVLREAIGQERSAVSARLESLIEVLRTFNVNEAAAGR